MYTIVFFDVGYYMIKYLDSEDKAQEIFLKYYKSHSFLLSSKYIFSPASANL